MIKHKINSSQEILDIGCGEGQNAIYLMKKGYSVKGCDVSLDAIKTCVKYSQKNNFDGKNFFVLDILDNSFGEKFDVIYANAVLHMLVLDEDRKRFLDFIFKHLKKDGIAFIAVMGDGKQERQSDITKAFEEQERTLDDGKKINVAGTTCRIVNKNYFLEELKNCNLKILDYYTTTEIIGFGICMIAEVNKK